jgi:hypothetical protein
MHVPKVYWGDAGLLFDVYAMCPWCSMHLKWLDWYFNVALCYYTPLDELLHPPIVPLMARRTERVVKYFRYGLLFKA